jgi:Icc protein
MVCLHHHPIAMGSRWLDSIGLANADEFWRIIDAHPHVRAVSFGHVHQEYEGRRGTVQIYATPSTGAQFEPHSERFSIDARPPAYRPFELHDDGRIETQVQWVESMPMQRAAAL